jgi:hypothetical protein
MTIQALLNDFALKFSHTHSNSEMIVWINEVDNNVYADSNNLLTVVEFSNIANQENITLPVGVEFEDITCLQVEDIPYKGTNSNISVYDSGRIYYFENGKIEIRPIQTVATTVKLVYKAKPTEKTIADIATELLIPKKFQDIYKYYLMAQISLVRKEFSDYGNYISLFNARSDDYEKWYQARKGIKPAFDCIIDEGWSNYETSDFD